MADNNIHETNRNTKTARATQETGHTTAKQWSWNPRNCSTSRLICQLCRPLERCLQKIRPRALDSKPPPHRPCRLSEKQLAKLQKLLLKGARANGYKTELWTLKRIAQIIRKHFGVHYQLSGIWYILSRLKWSCQKPERRGKERNEQAIEMWRKKRWPYIKKRANKW